MGTDYSIRVRLTNTIFMMQGVYSAAQIAIVTLLALVAVDLSGAESLAGIPSTTLTLTQALVALPMGVLMGRMGRRFGLGVSYVVSIFGAMLGVAAVMVGSFGLLLVSSALLGAGRAGDEQSRFAAGDMFQQGERAKMIGRVVFARTIGAVFGPLLVAPSGWLAIRLGLLENSGPWLLGIGLYAIAAIMALTLLRPDPLTLAIVDKKVIGNDGQPKQERSLRQLLRHPQVQLAVLSMLISQLVMVALMVITPVHMGHHDHGTGAISLVIMAHTIGMFGLSGLTGMLIERYGVHLTMLAGALILIASAVIAPITATMPILIVGLFLLGLGWNFCYIAGSALLSQGLSSTERGSMQGTNDMLVAGAAALGSFGSGPVYGLGDYGGVAGVGIVITSLFLFMLFVLRNQNPPASAIVGVSGD